MHRQTRGLCARRAEPGTLSQTSMSTRNSAHTTSRSTPLAVPMGRSRRQVGNPGAEDRVVVLERPSAWPPASLLAAPKPLHATAAILTYQLSHFSFAHFAFSRIILSSPAQRAISLHAVHGLSKSLPMQLSAHKSSLVASGTLLVGAAVLHRTQGRGTESTHPSGQATPHGCCAALLVVTVTSTDVV